jgi:predicted dehydrogenase
MEEKMKFGVLGNSRVGSKVFPAMLDSERVSLDMMGSRNSESAKEGAAKYGIETWGTYEDTLNNESLDAIYISLPNTLHEEWAIKALEAGKHVICEKPAALSYSAAKRMVAAAKKNKRRLMEGLMFRYHPQHAKVKELIENGTLGELVRFDACFGMPMQDGNMINKELGGGSLNYMAPYPIYASRMIFGEEPRNIFCKMKLDNERGVDTRADMLMEYSNGKIAFASTILNSYFQSTYSVLGSKANIRMSRAYAVPRDMGTEIFLDSDDRTEKISIAATDQFRIMLDTFCGEVLKGEGSAEDYEGDLLAQARVLEAARFSASEGRTVDISEIN